MYQHVEYFHNGGKMSFFPLQHSVGMSLLDMPVENMKGMSLQDMPEKNMKEVLYGRGVFGRRFHFQGSGGMYTVDMPTEIRNILDMRWMSAYTRFDC